MDLSEKLLVLAKRIVSNESEIKNVKSTVKKIQSRVEAAVWKQGEPGKPGEDGLPGKNGKDGRAGRDATSITDVYISADGHLVVLLTDGSEIDAGEIPASQSENSNVYSISKQTGLSEVFIDEEPSISYPAIAFAPVAGTIAVP